MKKIAIGCMIALSIGGNGFFAFQYLDNHRPPSFYYQLFVKNETSAPYLLVSLVQLTDVLLRVPAPPGAWTVVAKGREVKLQIPGEGDEPTTVFCLVAVECDNHGNQMNVPAGKIIYTILPFGAFRSNTFKETNADGNQKKTFCLRDEAMQPVHDLTARDINLNGCQ